MKHTTALDRVLLTLTFILSVSIAIWASTLTDDEFASILLALTTSYTVASFLLTFVCTPISNTYRNRQGKP